MFKLYEGTGNHWLNHSLQNYDIIEMNGQAYKTFQNLNVSHQYECGVSVVTSKGITTPAAFKSKWTKMPKEKLMHKNHSLDYMFAMHSNHVQISSII